MLRRNILTEGICIFVIYALIAIATNKSKNNDVELKVQQVISIAIWICMIFMKHSFMHAYQHYSQQTNRLDVFGVSIVQK